MAFQTNWKLPNPIAFLFSGYMTLIRGKFQPPNFYPIEPMALGERRLYLSMISWFGCITIYLLVVDVDTVWLSVYDTSGAASDRNSVVLNDIHIDIMDYIVPASCTDTEFRQMWAEFEWENKVAVNTNISDLHEYLDHIIQCTNMKCLTPEKVDEYFSIVNKLFFVLCWLSDVQAYRLLFVYLFVLFESWCMILSMISICLLHFVFFCLPSVFVHYAKLPSEVTELSEF